MNRILIVEDDRDIAELIAHYLEKAGHATDIVGSGSEAIRSLQEARPTLVVLDVMLPGIGGIEICRRIRADSALRDVPIIMVTARGDEQDRVSGLELGADDYVAKPFSPRELTARVGALLRRAGRTGAALPPVVSYGSIQLDRERHRVVEGTREVRVTAKEFVLLEYFLERPGRVLSRDVLLTEVWGYRYTGGTRTVDVHVSRLREKLPTLADALLTVKQFGYKLVEADERAAPAPHPKDPGPS